MKKFTFKDFISYNNPCFNCGKRITIRIGFKFPNGDLSYLMPIVNPECTEVNLRVTYRNTLKLRVFNKTNKFETNDPEELSKYLQEHNLYLVSRCDCAAYFQTESLKFDLSRNIIYSFGMTFETLIVSDESNLYHLYSDFLAGESVLVVDRIDKIYPISAIRISLPLLPLYRLKNKEKFINKMRTYLTFS